MEPKVEVDLTLDDEDLPLKHQLGKTITSGTAAFVAGKLADKAYDALLYAYRARRNK